MRVNPLLKTILSQTFVGVSCAAPVVFLGPQVVMLVLLVSQSVKDHWQGEDDCVKEWSKKYVPNPLQGRGVVVDTVMFVGVSSLYFASLGVVGLCLAKHSMRQFSNISQLIRQFRNMPTSTGSL
jgi:hypothetical protein